MYMIWPRGGAYMGLNVHVMCKYICNRVDIVIKGPHVQVWIAIYKISCILYWEGWIVKYERYLFIWREFPYYLRSYCVTYLYWSCAPHWHSVHGVCFYYILIFWAFWIIKGYPRVQFKEDSRRFKTLSLIDGWGCKNPNPRWLSGYVKYRATRKRRGSIL